MPDEQTYIEEEDVYVCDNCGAFASPEKTIIHHASCQEGEGKYWEEFYDGGEERR